MKTPTEATEELSVKLATPTPAGSTKLEEFFRNRTRDELQSQKAVRPWDAKKRPTSEKR